MQSAKDLLLASRAVPDWGERRRRSRFSLRPHDLLQYDLRQLSYETNPFVSIVLADKG
jgi:hypothetical protein